MPLSSAMDKHIESQIKFWESQKQKTEFEEKKIRPFITISREYGCGGFELAVKITEITNQFCKLGDKDCLWTAYDKKLLEKITADMGITEHLFNTLTSNARKDLSTLMLNLFDKKPPQVTVYRRLVEAIRVLAINGNVIIVGRAGNYFTKDMPGGFHVRVIASMESKIERVSKQQNIDKKEAEKLIIKKGKEREGFIRDYIKHDLTDPVHYHITINDSKLSLEESAMLVKEGLRLKGLI